MTGRRARRGREQLTGRLEQEQALDVRIGDSCAIGGDRGYEPRQRTALRRRECVDRFGGARTHEARQHFDPGLVRDAQVFVGVAEQHHGAVGVCGAGRLRDERSLAHACFAGDEHDLALTVGVRPLARGLERLELGRTTEEPEQGIVRRADESTGQGHRSRNARGLPHDLDRVDRLRNALQSAAAPSR